MSKFQFLVCSSGSVWTELGIYKRRQEIVRKEKKKHALDQEKDQEKKKVFRLNNNTKQFYFQPLLIVSVICRFDQIECI